MRRAGFSRLGIAVRSGYSCWASLRRSSCAVCVAVLLLATMPPERSEAGASPKPVVLSGAGACDKSKSNDPEIQQDARAYALGHYVAVVVMVLEVAAVTKTNIPANSSVAKSLASFMSEAKVCARDLNMQIAFPSSIGKSYLDYLGTSVAINRSVAARADADLTGYKNAGYYLGFGLSLLDYSASQAKANGGTWPSRTLDHYQSLLKPLSDAISLVALPIVLPTHPASYQEVEQDVLSADHAVRQTWSIP